MALTATARRGAAAAAASRAMPVVARPARRTSSTLVAAAANGGDEAPLAPATPDRRAALLALASAAAAAVTAAPAPARAEGEYATFLGYATPPTSYGGYGGNANEPRESLVRSGRAARRPPALAPSLPNRPPTKNSPSPPPK
jgi:hypothetical protein